ncbi:hypothetical protein O0L34_g3920 [Tuta absoluta]|nr:hypothetical protein O0L34_g3920 [Tuta absoluta]
MVLLLGLRVVLRQRLVVLVLQRLVLRQLLLLRQRHHAAERAQRAVAVLERVVRRHRGMQAAAFEIRLHRQHVVFLRRVQLADPSFTVHNKRTVGRSHGLAAERVRVTSRGTGRRGGYVRCEEARWPGAATAGAPRVPLAEARPAAAPPMAARRAAPPRPRAPTRRGLHF